MSKENNCSRRDALKLIAKGFALGAVPVSVFSRTVKEVAESSGTIVVLFQRGGCDGIQMLPPKPNTQEYNFMFGPHGIRREEPMPDALIDKQQADNGFALHPAMSHIQELWQNNQITFFPASHTGINLESGKQGSTSHFTGQAIIEDGGFQDRRRHSTLAERGWISRALPPETDQQVTGIAFGGNDAFAGDLRFLKLSSLQGQVLPVQLSKINSSNPINYDLKAKINNFIKSREGVCNVIDSASCASREVQISTSMRLDWLKDIYENNIQSSSKGYSRSNLGGQLKSIAALIKGKANISFITLDQGGYDHHSNMPSRLSTHLTDLSTNLKAFSDDCKAVESTVRVIVISEFGRTVRLNRAKGTDHGQASTPFVMSCGLNSQHQVNVCFGDKNQNNAVFVNKRQMWPGYEQLIVDSFKHGNYLNAITDYRDILYEVMQNTLSSFNTDVFNKMDSSYQHKSLDFIAM